MVGPLPPCPNNAKGTESYGNNTRSCLEKGVVYAHHQDRAHKKRRGLFIDVTSSVGAQSHGTVSQNRVPDFNCPTLHFENAASTRALGRCSNINSGGLITSGPCIKQSTRASPKIWCTKTRSMGRPRQGATHIQVPQMYTKQGKHAGQSRHHPTAGHRRQYPLEQKKGTTNSMGPKITDTTPTVVWTRALFRQRGQGGGWYFCTGCPIPPGWTTQGWDRQAAGYHKVP